MVSCNGEYVSNPSKTYLKLVNMLNELKIILCILVHFSRTTDQNKLIFGQLVVSDSIKLQICQTLPFYPDIFNDGCGFT